MVNDGFHVGGLGLGEGQVAVMRGVGGGEHRLQPRRAPAGAVAPVVVAGSAGMAPGSAGWLGIGRRGAGRGWRAHAGRRGRKC
jgi:hypothetical protein